MTPLALTLLYMRVVWVTPALEPVYAQHYRDHEHGAELRALEQAEQLELAAELAGVPLELLAAVREDESHFDDGLVGAAGELGGMQLLPGTPWWRGWLRDPGCIPRAWLSRAELVWLPACESANVLWGAYALRDALVACGWDQHAALGFYRSGRCVRGPRGAATLELAEWLAWRLDEP
jgi:hypothetical protein